jgi:hypothetical protein
MDYIKNINLTTLLEYLDNKINYDENGMKIFKDKHKIEFPYFI